MKKHIVLLLVALSACLVACGQKGNIAEPEMNEITTTEEVTVNSNGASVFASYSEGANSFDELLEKAEFILFGTVEETWKISIVNHSSRVRVTKSVKGETAEEITIWQVEGDNNLQVGDNVILFLNSEYKDEETRLEKQIYYPLGGGNLSAYKYVNDPSEVQPRYSSISKEELVAWVKSVIE